MSHHVSRQRQHTSTAVVVALASAALSACGGGTVARHRPTILTEASPPPPAPPPAPDEERLEAVALHPGASEPTEVPPGDTLALMARRALDAAQYDIIACYSGVLPEAPDAEGSIELQIDVSPSGNVVHLTVDHLAHAGLERALPCIRQVVQGLHVRGVDPRGHYVSRVYTFTNPPIEVANGPAVNITPPPRPARTARRTRPARGAHGSAQAPAAAAPAPTPPANTHRGSLTAAEISETLAASNQGLAACYGTLLRRARAAAGPARLTLEISGRGTVENASFESAVHPIAGSTGCLTAAARAVTFRASGTHTRVVQALQFHR